MNEQQVKDLQAWIDHEKEAFDRTYVQSPEMSLKAKQEAFTRFLQRLSPSLLKLKAVDDERDAHQRKLEALKVAHENARDREQLLQMRRYQKRGAA